MNDKYVKDNVMQIVTYLKDTHDKHAGGCKGSCHERSVGYHHSTYGESYWYASFGGYCLADLSRSEEVKANNLHELLPKVRAHIESAFERQRKHEEELDDIAYGADKIGDR